MLLLKKEVDIKQVLVFIPFTGLWRKRQKYKLCHLREHIIKCYFPLSHRECSDNIRAEVSSSHTFYSATVHCSAASSCHPPISRSIYYLYKRCQWYFAVIFTMFGKCIHFRHLHLKLGWYMGTTSEYYIPWNYVDTFNVYSRFIK